MQFCNGPGVSRIMIIQPIHIGDILRYATMPAIMPRARNLLGSGFGSFAFFVALVFRAVRLLPDGHPYLNPSNIGKFGVATVILQAWRHIYNQRKHLGRGNIDQIIVFGAVILAILLLVTQLFSLLTILFLPQAFAFPGNFVNPIDMFGAPKLPAGVTLPGVIDQPFADIAFIFLDRVFGVIGPTNPPLLQSSFFGSCIGDGVAGSCPSMGPGYANNPGSTVNDPATFPWPYHEALHAIFQFYSVGLLVVAIFLIIYYVFVVVAETAQTGIPFGKRFDTVWAPLRLVMAAGLLIPIGSGLNSGQYIVLYAAKWGSNFASNGWIGFNSLLVGNNTPAGDKQTLVAKPQIPDLLELAHFISVYHACKHIEEKKLIPKTKELVAGAVNNKAALPTIKPYLVQSRAAGGAQPFFEIAGPMEYEEAVAWANYGDVVLRFGIQDKDAYKSEMGTVFPFCGEITFKTVCMPFDANSAIPANAGTISFRHEGCSTIMGFYWAMILEWLDKAGKYDDQKATWDDGLGLSGYGVAALQPQALPWNIEAKISRPYYLQFMKTGSGTLPTTADRTTLVEFGNKNLAAIVQDGVDKERNNATAPFGLNGDLMVRGWAAAAVWYNRIAEMNGTMTASAWNLPRVTKYPATMQHVAEEKQKVEVSVPPDQAFNPFIQNNQFAIQYDRGETERDAANTYWQITKWWQADGGFSTSSRALKSGNVILDIINWMFGTTGLFSIRDNSNVHPMAQLSSIGKSLIERSIGLLGVGLGGTALQPWVGSVVGLRQAMGVLSGFAFSTLSIGASAGFILYYIIPFLPFIYYFFAVSGWVKAIFEAMVGVPLWALAHIRIDGHGLPGDAASAGYFLILEILLRPILIVFGLIASVTIYAASVHVLNDIFNLAVANVSGIDMTAANANQFTLENLRSSIDILFFTVLYVILVYMLGMSSFKLIDLIPGSMMRWMGSGVTPFTDSGDQAASQLVSYGTMGSGMVFKDLGGAARSGVEGLSGAVKAIGTSATKP